MTTKNSPLRVLQAQADQIATQLKAAERGDTSVLPAEKRAKPTIKVGIVMDDKVLTPEIAWETIRELSFNELAKWIVDEMREKKNVGH